MLIGLALVAVAVLLIVFEERVRIVEAGAGFGRMRAGPHDDLCVVLVECDDALREKFVIEQREQQPHFLALRRHGKQAWLFNYNGEYHGLRRRADQRGQAAAGQQQRVAIARSLINDPKLLLADEPTGNLDSRTAHEIFDLFASLVEHGKTLLVVTHDKEIAARAPRVIEMADGQIVKY